MESEQDNPTQAPLDASPEESGTETTQQHPTAEQDAVSAEGTVTAEDTVPPDASAGSEEAVAPEETVVHADTVVEDVKLIEAAAPAHGGTPAQEGERADEVVEEEVEEVRELEEPTNPETSETEPPTQDDFGAFGPGASLMFHAPDPDEIRKAAEAQAARQREAAQEREAQRAAGRSTAEDSEEDDESASVSSRRRRRRRRGEEDMELVDESDDSVTRVRAPRGASEGTGSDEVTGVKGSTRLEAKRQRRRESRQFGRKRHVITEAEFLARRESVERTMLVRQKENRIQIGVLEDGILAEHFVSHTQQDSLIGNVYVGKVQNVLPSMEAAFVDIGRGRNAVLYAGEVDWDAAELGKKPRKIENALKSGDTVLVQVTKDPVGHKGARLTSQVSLPGRYLVYVPGGSMTGISRKLPDVERQRLKKILKDRLPEGAGVIVRTAAEGASETELTNDINRLRSQWEQIQEKAGSNKTLAPEMLYAEPDLTIKTVRDVFNEDFTAMVVQGEQAWDNIEAYVTYVAPDLLDRLQRWTEDEDLFEHMRVEEQIQKALERKVFLPSGGSLVIDRTEAMTVVDVNTGKFTGSGGNLEETVTKNNLEAAEEIVRQLRLRDIGGIIVVDFIDMVLESNRDLVLRRLVECLGRDRTKHQVAEVTSLGLVQMTRKRMGTGLLEVFSEPCEECAGRGVVVHDHPLKGRSSAAPTDHRGNRNERKRSRSGKQNGNQSQERTKSSTRGNGGGSGGEEHNEARAEATRTAFANIAAASTHEEDDAAQAGSAPRGTQAHDASASQQGETENHQGSQGHGDGGESEGGRRRKKRRGKRSRGRTPQGEENGNGQDENDASDESSESSSVTIHGEVIELPQAQSGQGRSARGRSSENRSGRGQSSGDRSQRGSEDRGEQAPGESSESLTLDSLTAAFTGSKKDDDAADRGESASGSQRQGRGGRRSRRAQQSQGEPTQSSEGADRSATSDRSETSDRPEKSGRRAAAETSRESGTSQQTASTSPQGGSDSPRKSAAAQQASTAQSTGTAPQQDSAPAAPARRRRGSRRAVAPAGPGTASVQKSSYESQAATVSRFTAEATSVKTASTDGQPTIVGVGVKAQDITMTRKGE